MQVSITTRSPAEVPSDLLALPLAQLDLERLRLPPRAAALDRALGGRLAAVLATGDFRGRRGDSLLLYGQDGMTARRLLLVGLGEEETIDAETLRGAAAAAVQATSQRSGRALALLAPTSRRLRAPAVAQALAEGVVLGGYRFDRYRSPSEQKSAPPSSALLVFERGVDLRATRSALAEGVAVAESQNLARELSNEPPGSLTPAALAQAAQRVAREVGLRCRVLGVEQLRRRKMGAILAVGSGSAHPPRLVVLEYDGPRRGRRAGAATRRPRVARPPVALIGKGITFDSGGLSIKPAASMPGMKHDMSGGAAVIGAMRAAALLRLPVRVVGVIGCAENMPSGSAYRPSDIVTTMSGKTVEIANTDAEGRLVLADALHFARSEYRPAAMVDLATLTGACIVALGRWAAAVLGNHERLGDALRRAGEAAGEKLWPLPLWDVHRDFMRSRVADLKQTGGRDGGTITAAAFLWHFAGDTPWAHLDIASTSDTDQETPLQPAGATGFGVRTLVEFLRGWPRLELD